MSAKEHDEQPHDEQPHEQPEPRAVPVTTAYWRSLGELANEAAHQKDPELRTKDSSTKGTSPASKKKT